MKLTPKRRAYLERLLDGPLPRDGSKGKTGYDCMQADWTEWDFQIDGKRVSRDEYRQAIKDGYRPDAMAYEERLTPAGRAVVEKRQDGGGHE